MEKKEVEQEEDHYLDHLKKSEVYKHKRLGHSRSIEKGRPVTKDSLSDVEILQMTKLTL